MPNDHSVEGYGVKPVSRTCASIYEAKDHAVIGVSPFNSYFSEERLTKLFTWAHRTFRAFHIFVPDEATRYTLEAVGYSEGRARRKARRQTSCLLNKVDRALRATSPDLGMSLVLTNSALKSNRRYKTLLPHVELPKWAFVGNAWNAPDGFLKTR